MTKQILLNSLEFKQDHSWLQGITCSVCIMKLSMCFIIWCRTRKSSPFRWVPRQAAECTHHSSSNQQRPWRDNSWRPVGGARPQHHGDRRSSKDSTHCVGRACLATAQMSFLDLLQREVQFGFYYPICEHCRKNQSAGFAPWTEFCRP